MKLLKGTDWYITPTRLYKKVFKTYIAYISRKYAYTSRKGNNYKTQYLVNIQSKEMDSKGCAVWSANLGRRRFFRDAVELASYK